MKVETRSNPDSNSYTISINISANDFIGGTINISDALNEAAKELAKEYIEKNSSKILAELNPLAISNLAIAESAKLVRKNFIDPPKSEKEGKK